MFPDICICYKRLEQKPDFCVVCQAVTRLSMLQFVALQIRAI